MSDEKDPRQTAPAPALFSGPSDAPAMELTSERPSHVDRYEIRHELGRGAMGSVFAAWDPKLCREVAVKIVATQQRNNAKGRARFLREARAIAAIGQPNVVQIFDYSGLDSQALYLVMEKLEGRDLWELMHTHRMFPEAIAALVGHELCLALEAAHQVGIIHRDLKPENVFVTHAGRVVLTDFGIVKAIATDAAVEGYTERTEVIGTPGFMAPELLRGKSLTPATDVFALGALLYNIATLKMPYEGQSPMALFQAAQKGDYIDPRRYQPQLSEAFCDLVKQCLQAHPAARPPSASAVRLMLKQILNDLAEHSFGDDMLLWLRDPQRFGEDSHRRAVAHLLTEMTVAHARGLRAEVERHKERLLALDPFNEDYKDLLATPPSTPSRKHESPVDSLVSTVPLLELDAQGNWPQAPAMAKPAGKAPKARLQRPKVPRRLISAGVVMLTLAVVATDGWAIWSQRSRPRSAHANPQAPHLALVAESPAVVAAPEATAAPAVVSGPVASVPTPVALGPTTGPATSLPGETEPSTETAVPAVAAPREAAQEVSVAKPIVTQADVEDGWPHVSGAGPGDAVTNTLNPPAAAALSTQLPLEAADPAAQATLDVDVDGRGAWLILDGHGIGHIHHKQVSLPAGRHRVVLVRAGHTLRRWLMLGAGEHRSWHAE